MRFTLNASALSVSACSWLRQPQTVTISVMGQGWRQGRVSLDEQQTRQCAPSMSNSLDWPLIVKSLGHYLHSLTTTAHLCSHSLPVHSFAAGAQKYQLWQS